MMSDLNKFICKGHLTRNAELSYFQDGTPYCKFSLGNNKTWKNQNGEYESISSYFDFVMKGKFAEAMAKYLTKGRGVTIVSRAKQQRWESDGQKFSKVVFEVEEIDLQPVNTGNADSGNSGNWGQKPQTQQNMTEPEMDYIPFDENGEDIPF